MSQRLIPGGAYANETHANQTLVAGTAYLNETAVSVQELIVALFTNVSTFYTHTVSQIVRAMKVIIE